MHFSVFAAALLVAAAGASALPQTPQPNGGQDPGAAVAVQPAAGVESSATPAFATITGNGSLDAPYQTEPTAYETATDPAFEAAYTPAPWAPSAVCKYNHRPVVPGFPAIDGFNYFRVYPADWPKDPRGCGRGILDNLRGQMGRAAILDWRCEDRNYPTSVHFKVSTVFGDVGPKAEKAIQLASPGGNATVDCRYIEM